MPKISIITATNRPQHWQRFCDHISKNSIEIENIFVGPINQENIELAVPTRFISTGTHPALAWEIGVRKATGDLVCYAADDICFTPGFFDAAAAANITGFNMVTARFYQDNIDQFGGMRMMSHPSMPLTPVAGVMLKESHLKLGGIDRRFNAVLWDADLYMRFYEAGGRTTLLDGHICREIVHGSTMFVRNYDRDIKIIHDLWFKNGSPQLNRNSPIQPYTDEETT